MSNATAENRFVLATNASAGLAVRSYSEIQAGQEPFRCMECFCNHCECDTVDDERKGVTEADMVSDMYAESEEGGDDKEAEPGTVNNPIDLTDDTEPMQEVDELRRLGRAASDAEFKEREDEMEAQLACYERIDFEAQAADIEMERANRELERAHGLISPMTDPDPELIGQQARGAHSSSASVAVNFPIPERITFATQRARKRVLVDIGGQDVRGGSIVTTYQHDPSAPGSFMTAVIRLDAFPDVLIEHPLHQIWRPTARSVKQRKKPIVIDKRNRRTQ